MSNNNQNSTGQIFAQQTEAAVATSAGELLKNFNSIKKLPMLITKLAVLMLFFQAIRDNEWMKFFTFLSTDYVWYFFQKHRYSEKVSNIYFNGKKYVYDNLFIMENTLRYTLSAINVHLDTPGDYYYNAKRFTVKITIKDKVKEIKNDAEYVAIVVHTINNPVYHEDFMKLFVDIRDMSVGGKTVYKILPGNSSSSMVLKTENIRIGNCYENPAYTRINESLKKMEKIGKLITPIKVPNCISFNGPPGTGKTSYLISSVLNKVFDTGYLINMIDFVDLDFKDFLTKLKQSLQNTGTLNNENSNILLMFDEVDKWLKMRNDAKVKASRDESRKTESKKLDGKEETTTSARVLTKEEEEDDKQFQKNLFLKQLQQFLNGSLLTGFENLTIILNTNNVDELFCNVSYEHESLINRINRFSFGPFGKEGVIHYMRYLVENLKKINIKFTVPTDNDYAMLPDDIQISCRTLSNYFAGHGMDLMNLIEYLAKEDPDHVTKSRFVNLICK